MLINEKKKNDRASYYIPSNNPSFKYKTWSWVLNFEKSGSRYPETKKPIW